MKQAMHKNSKQDSTLEPNVSNGHNLLLRVKLLILATVILIATGFSGTSSAIDVYLQAQPFEKTLKNNTTVPMWGYQWCRQGFVNCGQAAATQDAPGPQLNPYTINFGVQPNESGATLYDQGNPGVTITGLLGNGNPAASVRRTRQGIGVANANIGTNQTAVFDFDNAIIPKRFSLWSAGGNSNTSLEVTLDGNLVTAAPIHEPLPSLPTTHENAGGTHGWITYQIDGTPTGTTLAIKNTTSGAPFRVKEITAVPVVAPSTGPNLTVHLRNALRTPTSIIIPGQANGGNPVMAMDSLGRSRVQSFTTEVAARGDIQTYNFTNLRPGTYLYQSGTHPSIQVPMGLYGALVVDAGAGNAYPGIAPDTDAILLLSEIDPIQNLRADAALTATLGAPGMECVPLADYIANATVGYPCTVDYNPIYRLVNGAISPEAAMAAGRPGDNVLFRFLNAGLRSHTPAIIGPDMGLIAEDGNPYPGLIKQQSHALLPAGKTLDVLVAMPNQDVTFSLFDRTSPSNSGISAPGGTEDNPDALPAGGILVQLQVGTGTPPAPIATTYAVDDVYNVVEDTPLNATSVLGNDVMLSNATVAMISSPSNGTINLNSNGTFTYTPNENYSGPDGFTYSASTSDGNSYPAQVTLNVSFVNDAPMASVDGPYTNSTGTTITVAAAAGVLGNDADPDGDTLTAVLDGTPPAGLTLNADGSFTYTGNAQGTPATFSYFAFDGSLQSDSDPNSTGNQPTTVTLNFNPVANIALSVQDPDGVALTDYRWLVQEDATFHHDPNAPDALINQQSLNFHKSYMPIVAQGSGAGEFSEVALDPSKHYYVSVLPDDGANVNGHSIGGAQIPPGSSAVTVYVNKQPIPTAQISVLVFNDNFPTNGAPDANEPGLEGFQIILEDAGGRYGMSGGTMSQDAFGTPLKNWLPCAPAAATGIIVTCPDGSALIKDLPPGKYGVIAVKPSGGPDWVQTSTIEGSKVIDAWVKANEPEFFLEFGGQMQHAFIGFVDPETTQPPVSGSNSISGQVTLLHDPRPPGVLGSVETGSYDALGFTRAWVGLNDNSGDGANIRTVHAEPDGSFMLDGIPNGNYQLVVWDDYLDQIIAYQLVDVVDSNVELSAPIAVNAWFTRTEHNVFMDMNENGILDNGESPLSEQAINLRWRDGTVNQSFPTDLEGYVSFDQTFPFFSWQVLEVDYTRFKATGMTATVDGGGDVNLPDNPYPGLLNPQVQANGELSRTETGPVLTQAFQGFPGQTSVFNWGKKPYEVGENGGISGIVFYGSTRGENDPRLTVGDPWEPGIPGVKVRLYREVPREAPFNIAVSNASFEEPILTNGSSLNSNPLPAWIKIGSGRIFNPYNNANVAEGTNMYQFQGDGSIQQMLGEVLKEGSYNLSVAVGDQGSNSITIADYQVQLGVMQGSTFVLLAEDNDSLSPDQEYLTSTVTYTATAEDPSLGLPLVIRLVASNTSSSAWVLFDDVRLELTTDSALTLVAETTTDSWDRSLPEGCPGEDPQSEFAIQTLGVANIDKCYDGFRNWNQARPGVFDGGYAFNDIPAGSYVVEIVPPPGYELIKEEDVNVGFGDIFSTVSVSPPAGGPGVFTFPDAATVAAALAPEPGIAQPPCVGDLREVPEIMSLFPNAAEPAPFATALRPLCNRKKVTLSDQGQAAADFHLFTTTPVAAQFTGLITDDISNESNPASPGFGEKWSPANLPVSLRDWTGREVYRSYGDSFGRYNGLLPSTYTANIPIPSGYSPAMLIACMNDGGDGQSDPLKLSTYGTACYTAQFMPGATTYLDTPVLPKAAFAGGFNPVDCAAVKGTPVITSVSNATSGAFGPLVAPGETIAIRSAGTAAEVPNPTYEGPFATAPYNEPTVLRDLSFGSGTGSVELIDANGIKHALSIQAWGPDEIRAVAPATPMTGELLVTRGDSGNASINSVTVTVDTETPIRVAAGDSIQAAIDSATNGALILVEPGNYNEFVIMSKPVRLQGSGSDTIINAIQRPTEKLQAWSDKVNELVNSGIVDLLPGQLAGLPTERGAGITVLAKRNGPNRFVIHPARIDGFTITDADSGGGIFVNGYAHKLEISNNNITGNSGFLHGGIRVGHPFLPNVDQQANANGIIAFNRNLNIHNNAITLNGAIGEQSIGGGLALATGSYNYTVANNFICGNYASGDGAGIAHLGQSHSGMIEHNQILFNQSFDPTANPSGGGIFIGGEPSEPPALSLGTGNVKVNGNLIQGNQAGSGHGGGIRTQFVNGSEIGFTQTNNKSRKPWLLRFTNNIIVNNVAGYSGGGISLQDTVRAVINNNTIANNDSTATVGGLIVGGATAPQPAGISAERYSLSLAAALNETNGFSNPLQLINNIIWHNRAFSFDGSVLQPVLTPTSAGNCPTGANYWDIGVLGEPQVPLAGDLKLNPRRSILTTLAGGYHRSNLTGNPDFISEYCNGDRTLSTPGPIRLTPAFGEGGNMLDIRFGPLTQEAATPWASTPTIWNYHIGAASAGLNNAQRIQNLNGTKPRSALDFDGDTRPQGARFDRGADERAL
ncbi:Ig-like domain-containing protein [Thiomicrorhabdus chilensis]|uniref:Ig-like domain-containing protein n=1 Tax=Thiomicrorhabdus chilensis TaxID=63656 RepID=UPI00042244E9|nr:Ig-like domain-containing protein [Thiomicrorhabdus chilensis]